MKRKLTVIGLAVWIVMVTVVLSGCNVRERFDYMHSPEEIQEISIVQVKYENHAIKSMDTLAVPEDTEAFLKDFNNARCYAFFGDPHGISEDSGVIVLKFSYENGDHELVDWRGKSEYYVERGGYNFYAGFQVHEQADFDALIEKYTQGIVRPTA